MRASSQSASAAAWRLVSDAENLQPALPVQATRPPRSALARQSRPSAAIAPSAASSLASGMSLISRFCHTVSRSVPDPKRLGDVGQAAQPVAAQTPDRTDDADIVQPGLFLRMHADMAVLVLRRTRQDRRRIDTQQRLAEFLLDLREERRHPHAVEHVFQPRLGAVGAIAVRDERAHDGVAHAARRRPAARSRRCRGRNRGAR